MLATRDTLGSANWCFSGDGSFRLVAGVVGNASASIAVAFRFDVGERRINRSRRTQYSLAIPGLSAGPVECLVRLC